MCPKVSLTSLSPSRSKSAIEIDGSVAGEADLRRDQRLVPAAAVVETGEPVGARPALELGVLSGQRLLGEGATDDVLGAVGDRAGDALAEVGEPARARLRMDGDQEAEIADRDRLQRGDAIVDAKAPGAIDPGLGGVLDQQRRAGPCAKRAGELA